MLIAIFNKYLPDLSGFLFFPPSLLPFFTQAVPKRPGTPEVAQTYNNTALVLWKPSDTNSPCSYSLERRSEGERVGKKTSTQRLG